MAEVNQLAAALAAAQAEMGNAVFNRINPHFKSQYADLAAIRDASVPALSKNGLAIAQYTRIDAEGLHLCTILMHKSGQYLEGTYPITVGTPQAMGSQLTYAKRYCWAAIVGISADDDDDGEVAEASKGIPRATVKKTAYKAHEDKAWETLKDEMLSIKEAHALKVWGHANQERIHALPDSWMVHFRELYENRLAEIKEGVTEAGEMTDFKRKLKESLHKEDQE